MSAAAAAAAQAVDLPQVVRRHHQQQQQFDSLDKTTAGTESSSSSSGNSSDDDECSPPSTPTSSFGSLAGGAESECLWLEFAEVSLASSDSKNVMKGTQLLKHNMTEVEQQAAKSVNLEHALQVEPEQRDGEIKCSAVHSLERDMPDYDYSHLVRELRDRILKECQLNVGLYAQKDVDKCKHDPWFVERFLLRQKLDLDKAFDMLKRTMRFRNESLVSCIGRRDFPAEFYQVGGLFCYEEDRKGNKMLYIRLKVHRKIPEIQLVLQAFLFYNIDYLDELAKGKGIALVMDCTGAGLANADVDMMMFLITTLVNYFPKGMSYLLVHELPWMLKPFWYIAKGFLQEEHRDLIKFSNSRTIYEYVNRENLPDFMGGTCPVSYTTPPEECTTLEQACKLWGIEQGAARKILLKFAQYLPPEVVAKHENAPSGDDEATTTATATAAAEDKND